jgi:ABC-2 type transport system ATP-binding protein
MDEAERCDRIVYIAYGTVMARGAVSEIIDQSRLVTYLAEGPDARVLAEDLRGLPGVAHVAYFGAALHVSGPDDSKLQAAIAPFRNAPGVTWEKVRPSLEDVFIELMGQAQERNK